MRPRHVPLRRCVRCGTKLPKRELIRIVRAPGGSVGVDITGKLAGRGAYLCHQHACWEQSLKKSRLDHALRGPISSGDRQILLDFAQTLPGRD